MVEPNHAGGFGPNSRPNIDQASFLNEVALGERAITIVTAMSESLELDRDEVRIVIEEPEDGNSRLVAIDASPMGQRIGTYAAIQKHREADPTWYMVEVDGELVDPLAACTRGAYKAMIANARNSGLLLPDSLALSQRTGEIWTATMLTGEPLNDDGEIIIASSNSEDKINYVGFYLDRGGKSIRVRPAVVVSQLDS